MTKVLLHAFEDTSKRSDLCIVTHKFHKLADTITKLESGKKVSLKFSLENLKKAQATVNAYTAKYPEVADCFVDRVGKSLHYGKQYLRSRDLPLLADCVVRLRADLSQYPQLRLHYPFETHIIEHAEDLVPDLVPFLQQCVVLRE